MICRYEEASVEWSEPEVNTKHQRGRRNAATRQARAERQARLRTAPVPAAPKATAPATVAETAASTADELPPGWHAYIFGQSHAPRETFNPARTASGTAGHC